MQKRSIGKMIGLTIITLGIYQLFWLYRTKQELVRAGKSVPSFWLLFSPFLILGVVAILQFVFHFAFQGSGETSIVIKSINILSLILGIIAVVTLYPITIYWYYKYCKAAESITNGELSFGFSFCLIIIMTVIGVSFIWSEIVQSYYNKLGEATPTNPAAPSQVQPVAF